METLLKAIAVLSSGLFAGAALYITAVEHPARMSLGASIALQEFRSSYRRAAPLQASLAVISFLCSMVVWRLTGGWAWFAGGALVGKGAIVGWRDVLAPVLRNDERVKLWPFDGSLDDLLIPGRIVVAETYPSECYGWFSSEPLRGKGKLEVRKAVGSHLIKWAASLDLSLEPIAGRHSLRIAVILQIPDASVLLVPRRY